jgi:hypothetical protein
MSDTNDTDLLHRAVDGALSPDEAARLRQRLAGDSSLRADAERLGHLVQLLHEVGQDEPPPRLTDQVMAAISARQAERRRSPAAFLDMARRRWDRLTREALGPTAGAAIAARRALWGVAGAAVVALLVLAYRGGARPVDQGAEGTIGAAGRAVLTQPAGTAAAGGDAQAFFQSDTFTQVLKNSEIRSLLANPSAVAALANGRVIEALRDQEAVGLIGDPNVQSAIAKADVEGALRRPDVMAVVASPELQAAIRDTSVARYLASPAFLAALKDLNLFTSLRARAEAALRTHASPTRVTPAPAESTPAVEITSQAELQAGLRYERFARLVSSAALREAESNDGAATAAVFARLNGPMAGVFRNANLVAAMQVEKGVELLANASLYAALKDPSFTTALHDARLPAALENHAALQAALGQ